MVKQTGSWAIDRRPKTIENIVLHPRILKSVDITEEGISRNFIFYGSYGKGKTTLMGAISSRYPKENVRIYDASRLNIEDIRVRVSNFMSQARLGKSLIVFDEVDSLPSKSQEVLSSLIEKSANTNFVCTGNTLKFHQRLRARLSVVDFDLTTKELLEIKDDIFSYYNQVSDKKITKGVLKYLFLEHKECLRAGVHALQHLNVIASDVIDESLLDDIKSTKPLLRAIFFSNNTDIIFKEAEEYGLEYIVNVMSDFHKYAEELKMSTSRDRIILEIMDVVPSLASVFETSLRKIIILGVLLKVNKIIKSDALRVQRRSAFLKTLPAEESKKY